MSNNNGSSGSVSAISSLYRRHVVAFDSRDREGYDASVQIWTPSTTYAVGQKVLVTALGYVCLAAHVSSATFEADFALGLWRATTVSSPSSYRIRFPAVRNVKMLRLLTSEMPNTQYVVNHLNRNLDFHDTATGLSYTAHLSMGTYTTAVLADEINTRMNAAMGAGFGVNFTCAYATTTQRFVITRNGGTTFSLLFASGPNGSLNIDRNPALVMGFTPGFDTPLLVTITSNGVVNLSGENYCYMVMKNYAAVQSSSKVNDVFAKIVWNVIPRNITFDSFVTNAVIYRTPKDVIDSFDVSFVSANGSFYDFNNVDHSFTVEFFCE